MNFREKSVVFIATGCFLGYFPIAPGTIGSLVGLPLCFIVSKMSMWVAAIFISSFILIAAWVSHESENLLKQKDPGCIIIDEIAGIMVVFWGLEFNLFTVTCGFFLFRFFDIVKPLPIRNIERRIKGGAGIVADDVLAGIYSHALLRLVLMITS